MSIMRPSNIELFARCYCCDAPDPPAPDPGIGQAAESNAAIAKEALDFNKQVYAENQPRQAAMDALATKVVNNDLSISDQNQAQANDQWNRFKTVFQPVEDKTVSDAMNIDSAGELNRAAGSAAAGVQTQFDIANAQRKREQVAMGINPNSGKALVADSDAAFKLAAAKAKAATDARLNARDRGIALRAGVANFGRNMPNTAANAYGIATSSGNSAVNNQGTTMTTANNNATQMNQGFGTAITGNNSAGSMLNQQYGNILSGYSAQQNANATSASGAGQLVGQLGVAAIKKYSSKNMESSKKVKHNKRHVDDGKTLEMVKKTPVGAWTYNKGVEDEGDHVGPYAEDMQKNFGDTVAPGGKGIDVISMMGVTMSAVKGLAKNVDKLDHKVSKIAASRGVKGARL